MSLEIFLFDLTSGSESHIIGDGTRVFGSKFLVCALKVEVPDSDQVGPS